MPIRTFSLNSPEAYEALGGRREEAWIPNGALPKEPRWPRGESAVWVNAEDDAAAAEAFRAWQAHVEGGRIGRVSLECHTAEKPEIPESFESVRSAWIKL